MCDVNISFGDCTNMAKMHGSWLCLLWSRRKAETTVEDDENCVVCVESQWNITFSSLYRAELKSTHLKLRNPHIFVVLKQFCSVFSLLIDLFWGSQSIEHSQAAWFQERNVMQMIRLHWSCSSGCAMVPKMLSIIEMTDFNGHNFTPNDRSSLKALLYVTRMPSWTKFKIHLWCIDA